MTSQAWSGRVRAALAPAAKTICLRTGVYAAVRRLNPSRRVAILRYHAICEPDVPGYADPSICVTPESFQRHVEYLARNYTVLPLPEIVRMLRDRRPLPSNAVSITFDDGYADNLAAAQLLARHGVSATFYITAQCVDGESPFWLSELRSLVFELPGPVLTAVVGGAHHTIRCGTLEERTAAIRQLTKLFKSHPIAVRESVREQLRVAAGGFNAASPMLTWRNLQEMHRLGMTIGAHTLTHPNLPSAGPVDAQREIEGAKSRLEEELGTRVTMFSYPNGAAETYFTPEIQRLVRQAGYEAATTSTNGFASAESDLYALERVRVAERLEDLVFALEIERFAFAPTARTYAGA